MPGEVRSDRFMSTGGRVGLGAVLALALAACAAQPKTQSPSSPAAAAPIADNLAAPVYHVGDSLTFSDNGTEMPRFVTAVQGDEVSWTDNANAKWTTSRDPILPPLSETPAGGGAEITRSFDPPNPTIFPLESGKQVSYKVTVTQAGSPPKEERDSCEVRQPDTIIVEAGTFKAWAIGCQRGEASETLYYAPEIGAIVLSSRDKDAKSRRLTLVDYQKAGAPRTQQAEATTKSPDAGADAGEAPGATAPSAAPGATAPPAAPPALPATPVSEKPLPPQAAAEAAAPAAVPSAAPAAASTGEGPAAPPSAPGAATPAAQPQETPAPIPAAKPATAQAPIRRSPPPRPTPTPTPRPAPAQLAALPPSQTPAPAAAEGGKYLVQYVSFNSPQDASRDWTALRARLPQLLGELKPRIDSVTTVGGTRLARISLGPFASEAQAKQLCSDLRAAGPDCWIRPLK